MVSINSHYLTALGVTRPRASGVLSKDAPQFIELFSPHMARTFQIQAKLDTLNVAAESTSAALDRWDTGLIALARHARVVGMNAAAEAMIKTQRSLMMRHDTVTAVDETQQPQLNKLIADSVRTGDGLGTGAGGALQLRGKDSTPVPIVITPFRSERLFAECRPCALLFIVDPAAKPLTRKTLLQILYGLTPAESRLVSFLLEGLDLKIAAEHLRVTTGTARFMLKQVFHKTSTHRQSQLIRLLSSLPGDST
jgi:DNA-binding CsgD family transcriptional regulator